MAFGLGTLVGRRCERRGDGPHGPRETQAKMAEATDTDDAYLRPGTNPPPPQRGKYSDPTAEQRRGRLRHEALRQDEHEPAVDPDALGKTSLVADAGGLLLRTEVLLAGETSLALVTG